ncbi:MAG: hypothetical protein U9O85_03685 [Euryarchaeota archaeon]|nr:hypothetical protein [Euryarchaeota archaeon]
MTSPAEGKLPLVANVYLNEAELHNAHVYVHLKGYARATVTHLDVEHPSLSGLIPPKVRTFIWIVGIEDGILIRTEKGDRVKVIQPLLNKVLPQGEKTKTCVGGKFNGLFIGFRKRELVKLEAIAEKLLSEQRE